MYPKIINNTFESCVKIYIVEWDGTKDELIKELYTNEAKRIYSPYDCTGEPFTTFFQVGHIKDNIYKVAEGISLDL